MTTTWRFDETDVGSMLFDEDVRPFLPAVAPALERALVEILENPLANPRAVVRGEVVYIKRLNPSLVSAEVVPALLLAYTAVHRERLIRKLALCRAADVAPDGIASSDEQIYRALERVVETVIRRAHQQDH
jgi:hypothetical protein